MLQHYMLYLLIMKILFYIIRHKLLSNNGTQRTNSNFDRILKNSLTSIKKPWQPYQLKAQVGSSCQGCLNDEACYEKEKELWYMMNRVKWGLVWSRFFLSFQENLTRTVNRNNPKSIQFQLIWMQMKTPFPMECSFKIWT